MKDILSNIRRTPFQSLSVVLLQFFGAFLLLTSLTSTGLLVSIFNTVEVQIPVIVYFKPSTEEKDVLRVRENLIQSDNVRSVEYVDKQKAFDFYREQNKDNPLLLEMTSAENFPSSLYAYAEKPAHLVDIANYLRTEKGIDEVQFDEEMINKLMTITQALRVSVLVLASYLALMTLVTLITMVMFKIALRKEEIELYRLLGATSGNIAKPFFDEGVFLSVVASLMAIGAFGGLVYSIKDVFSSYLEGIDTLTLSVSTVTAQIWPLHPVTIGTLCAAVIVYVVAISALATKVATDKYIRA